MAYLQVHSPDIVIITETWLDESLSPYTYFTPDYNIYNKDRNNHGGGVLIAVKNCYASSPMVPSSPTNYEIIGVNVIINEHIWPILGAYRPQLPADIATHLGFYLELENYLECTERLTNCGGIIIGGDFNETDAKGSDFHPDIQRVLDRFGLYQIITAPTRGGSFLDLLFTSVPDGFGPIIVTPGLSDHDIVHAHLNLPALSPRTSVHEFFCWNRADLDAAGDFLGGKLREFEIIEGSVNVKWLLFKHYLFEMRDKFVPRITKKTFESKPWLDWNIDKQKHKVKRLYNLAVKWNMSSSWNRYEKARSDLSAIIDNRRSKYYADFDNLLSANPKSFWKRVRAEKPKESIPPINHDGINYSDPVDKANVLNNFFGSIYSIDTGSDFPDFPPQTDNVMPDIFINRDGIIKQINDLQNCTSPGPDGIDARLLKSCPNIIAAFLLLIFVQSLQGGVVPDDWKVADIIPIPKGPRPSSQPNSYRPISLTSICCKIFEHILISSLMRYLDCNSLLCKWQYGFRRGSSCDIALAQFIDFVAKGMESGGRVDAISFDFARAFDCVPHRHLIHKMKAYGISAQFTNWYENFLGGRTHRVSIEGANSKWVQVTSGIPQGTVSGPILFLLYINDLPDNISCKMALYADDSMLYNNIYSFEDIARLQNDIDRVGLWCTTWGININPSKTQAICFGHSRSDRMIEVGSVCPYRVADETIEFCDNIVYLGVTINNRLSWGPHVDRILRKANRTLYFIIKTFNKAPLKTKKILYLTLVRPILEFACCVWNPYSSGLICSIESVQKRASRFIASEWGRNVCVTNLCNKLELVPLSVRRHSLSMGIFFKIVRGLTILQCEDYCTPYWSITRRGSTTGRFFQNFCSSSRLFYSFFPSCTRAWNALPNCVVDDNVNFELFMTFFKYSDFQICNDHCDLYF